VFYISTIIPIGIYTITTIQRIMPLIAELGTGDKMKGKYYAPYKTGRDALTKGEVERLLESFDSIKEKAIVQLAITTGLRRVDVVNINRNDYDPGNGKLTYYEHKKRRTRTIVIPSKATIQTLNMHLNSAGKSKWLFASPLDPNKHISDRHIYDIFNEHLDKIKLRRRPFHSLRATCIKLCKEAGWEDTAISELTGDTIRVIQEHYMVPSEDEMQELAENRQII
jgi:integrase